MGAAHRDLFERMVAIDSTSSRSNLPLVELISDRLERPGVRIDRVVSDDGTKANLVVQVGPDADPARRGGLILSGHLDCVPVEEAGWRTDPFTLTPTADGLAGRGGDFVYIRPSVAAGHFVDDHQPFLSGDGNGKSRARIGFQRRVTVAQCVFNVLRVMVAAVDDD